jgi:hypothetical protein
MRIFSGLANSIKRNEIKKFIGKLESESNDRMAERLLMVYSTRDIRLFPNPAQEARFRERGLVGEDIDHCAIYVYHYQKGNEVPILEMMELAQRSQNQGLWSSLNMHFYTNLAVSYSGYDALIRDMWNNLFRGSANLPTVYKKIFPDNALPDNRDISKKAYLENPRAITPHFFLSDSPITKELDKRQNLANQLGL